MLNSNNHNTLLHSTIVLILAIPIILVLFLSTSTFDNGDSIKHFLISKYAFQHSELFFDHWGKPFFTLLSSPFAQLGFKGICLFNAIIIYSTASLIYFSAHKLFSNIAISFICGLSYLFSTQVLLFVNSGLTEPLFGFLLILGIFLTLQQKYKLAAISISFIIFVRSEGMFIIPLFITGFIFLKQYKAIPLFFTGFVIYSIAGKLYMNYNFFWYFTNNPYPTGNQYGSGNWIHYFEQFYFFSGLVFSILFSVGLIFSITSLLKYKTNYMNSIILFWLILSTTGTYFFAHVIFWKIGCCGAFGIQRILMSIMPTSAIIIGFGLYQLSKIKNSFKTNNILPVIAIALVGFQFSGNPSAWKLDYDFKLNEDQVLANQLVKSIKPKISWDKKILVSDYYLAYLLNIDVFDSTKAEALTFKNMNAHHNMIWDSWYSTIDGHLSEETFNQTSRKTYRYYSSKTSSIKYITNF
jgi:hypothetical protein